MKRTDINKLIALHESRLARVLNVLDHYYFELEEQDKHTFWVNELTKEKLTLEWLRAQKADDE